MLVMFRQVDLKRASGPRGRRLVVLGRGYNVGAMLGRGSSFVGGGVVTAVRGRLHRLRSRHRARDATL